MVPNFSKFLANSPLSWPIGDCADWISAGNYKVNVGGQLYPVAVSLKPLYDPTNERIRP